MDEEGNSQGQEQQQQSKSTNIQNKAGQISRDMQNASNKLGKSSEYTTNLASKLQNKASTTQNANKAKKLNDNAKRLQDASKKLAKTAQKAQKFAQIAAKIARIIAIAGVIILIALIIIGLLVFLITGFGMIWSTVKNIGKAFWRACYNVMYGGETYVEDEDVVEVMQDLENMGYDLYGYGFVSSYATETETTTTTDDDGNETTTTEEVMKYYTEDEDGNVSLITSLETKGAYRYLITYLVSDNYAYYIKNNNFNFRTMFSSVGTFFSGIFDSTNWGSGLISIYKDNGDSQITGIRGAAYGSLFNNISTGISLANGYDAAYQIAISKGYSATEADAIAKASSYGVAFAGVGKNIAGLISGIIGWFQDSLSNIHVNRDAGTLVIHASDFGSNQTFSYDLDGWTGRYSMPLEFLLSVHLATMAPDLSYAMATEFNTDVEILLYKAKSQIIAGLSFDDDPEAEIDLDTFQSYLDTNSWFGYDLWFGRDDVMDLFRNIKQITSQEGRNICLYRLHRGYGY